MSRPWNTFTQALEGHFGNPRRAQTRFIEATRFGQSSIQHWRKTNRVPDEAFEALAQIDISTVPETLFTGHHPPDLIQSVIELSNVGLANLDIAQVLTVNYQRPITENIVKGIRLRNRDKIKNYQKRERKNA